MIEIEHLFFVCTWLILYLILQLCTWLIIRAWLSAPLALPASFAVSLLWSCLISWYLAWLTFSPICTLGVFFILTGIVFGTVQKARVDILSDLNEGKWHYALFFIVFLTMLIVRMYYPDISIRSWDKFMNHGFLTSIMRTPIVPPLDPWFAGGTLEVYYYLGHWCFATLGIIAHLPSWIVFQLVAPTVASVSAVQLYGMGKLLLKKFSVLPVILLFIVNPGFIYHYIKGVEPFYLLSASVRVIPETFTEYPLYTFLFGDAHAHAMAIFNQMLFILLIIYLFTQWQKLINSERAMCAILAGISLGTMVGMNSWNALSYGPIFILAAIVIWYQTHGNAEREEAGWVGTSFFKACIHVYHDVLDLLKKRTEISHSSATILYLWILVPLIAFLSYAPFFIMMQPHGAQGIGIVHTKTLLPEFFLAFGWFVFLLVCTLYSDIKKQPKLLVIAIPFVITGYPLIGLIFVLLAYLIARHEGVSDFLFACGLLLVLVCELVYMVDSTSWSAWYRLNTSWKLYCAAWFLLGLGALCSASIRVERFMDRVCHGEKGAIIEKCITRLVVGGIVVLILSVPILNHELKVVSYSEIQGLDAYAWMERTHPEDYAAAMYLRDLPGEHILVEADGDFDLYYTRMASITGIPTIMGSSNHEMSWRGDNPPGWREERKMDIAIIYEQPERISEIMEKYNANLLILGAPERKAYQIPDDPNTYPPDLVPIFTAGETTIYQRVHESSSL
jgi:YYY domain-containing protein